jgi:hypothetical protein
MDFYTYLWLRYDGTPYYVGKGMGKRAYWSHQRTVPMPPDTSRILVEFHPTEVDAFEAEKFLVAYYGRQDLGTGILRNRTDGGEGLSGLVFSPDHRRKLRNAAKNRKVSPETRQRHRELMLGNTCWKNRTAESIEKIRLAANSQWAAKTDRTQSTETRKRRSEAITEWWAARKRDNRESHDVQSINRPLPL